MLLVVGALLLVYVAYSWLFLDSVKGWASILALFVFFGSAQMLVLGVVGEYVGRIFMATKSRPLYLISEVVGAAASASEVRSREGVMGGRGLVR